MLRCPRIPGRHSTMHAGTPCDGPSARALAGNVHLGTSPRHLLASAIPGGQRASMGTCAGHASARTRPLGSMVRVDRTVCEWVLRVHRREKTRTPAALVRYEKRPVIFQPVRLVQGGIPGRWQPPVEIPWGGLAPRVSPPGQTRLAGAAPRRRRRRAIHGSMIFRE